MKKKRDRYFEISFSLHRSKKKRKPKSNLGGESNGGRDVFWEMVALSMFLITFLWIAFTFESLFTSVTLFNILLTLGGLETYDQTIIGLTILFLIGGCALIFGVFDD